LYSETAINCSDRHAWSECAINPVGQARSDSLSQSGRAVALYRMWDYPGTRSGCCVNGAIPVMIPGSAVHPVGSSRALARLRSRGDAKQRWQRTRVRRDIS